MAVQLGTFDYTESGNSDSLQCAQFTAYRFMHWMIDILKNYMSDPVNIHDGRLSSILGITGGGEACAGLFKVGPAYSDNDRKAGTTPAIIVGVQSVERVTGALNSIPLQTALVYNTESAGDSLDIRRITLTVAVATESYDGTVLLADAIYDFLSTIKLLAHMDYGAVSDLQPVSVSGPQAIQVDQAGNARQIYQSQITVSGLGGVRIVRSSTGPVFRGLTLHEAASGT